MLSAKSLILRTRAPLQQAARQNIALPLLITRQPRCIPSAVIAFRSQQALQERTLFTPTRVLFAANTADIEKGVQNITDLFMVARDELEYADEARGSVYYNDDKETARQAVQECLTAYDELLKDLNDAQKLDVQRKIGLKIMELKSQLDALNAEELE
ncbi:hypothetical protein BGZ70_001125 [Mortierella alpina]|uniref:Uncharacterized protein n=1 Tax=Mortierella alpina TaxID=64518 RepID=A0A9P6IYC0_MORAP|nr:hypothetical protein BGZ70_001125 [Mortierella alpina]